MSSKSGAGGATPATRALTRAGTAYVERRYEHDPDVTDFGQEAATALGVEPGRVFKTLVMDDGGALAVGVIPVTRRLDLKAVAAALGCKRVTLAVPADAQRATGYVVGGISPFGQRQALRTLVDASVLTHETVLVSGGRRGLDLELAPTDLIAATAARTANITRT